MEPKLPSPNFSSERTPGGYAPNIERPLVLPPNPETQVGSAERLEQRGETSSAPAQTMPVLPVLPAVPAPTPLPTQPSGVPADDLPLVANDDDLIEKEWVDKAKKIIIDTKDDPYRREKEVSRLQADYLRKRYGRELGAA